MIIDSRPSWVYGLLFALSLICWSLYSPLRMTLSVAALFSVAAAYSLKTDPLKPGLSLWAGISLLGLAFNYYIVYAKHPDPFLAIYSGRLFDALSLSLVGLIVLQWYSWRSRDFDWLLFSIGILLMLSAVSVKMVNARPIFIWLCLGFISTVFILRLFPRFKTHHPHLELKNRVLLSFYLRISAVVVLFMGTGLFGIRLSEYIDNQFNDILTQFLINRQQQWSGFSGHTHLRGNASIQLSNQIAFTIQGDNPPDYWRGNILTHYRDGHWFPEETLHQPLSTQILDGQQLYPLKTSLDAVPEMGTALLPLRKDTESERVLKIEMAGSYQGILFLPAESEQLLIAPQSPVYRNRYGLMRREMQESGAHYALVVNSDARIPAFYDQQMLLENLQIPPTLRLRLQQINRQIIPQQALPLQKARAIQNWFHANFVYSLSMPELPLGKDPTLDFLLNRRPAWCSWFASGMVLMLRAEGIPAHLVSGWRSMDWNPISRRWLVREKEAHDWVEVLDTEHQQWVRFDPTPPTQLAKLTGSGRSESWWQQGLDGISILFADLSKAIQNRSWQEIGRLVQDGAIALLRSPLFYLFMLISLGLNGWLKRSKPPLLAAIPLHYSEAPPAYQQALQLLQAWAESKALPVPQGHLLESWLLEIAPQLSASENQHFRQLVQRLYRIRFGRQSEHTAMAHAQDLCDLQKELQTTQEWLDELRYNKQTTTKAGDA